MIYSYNVKAIGLGFGLAQYPLSFKITSNNDIENNPEAVMDKVRNELKRNWGTAYQIKSVTKDSPK